MLIIIGVGVPPCIMGIALDANLFECDSITDCCYGLLKKPPTGKPNSTCCCWPPVAVLGGIYPLELSSMMFLLI